MAGACHRARLPVLDTCVRTQYAGTPCLMAEASGAADAPLHALSAEEVAIWAGFLQTHAALAHELDAELRAAHGVPLTEFEILSSLATRPCERIRMAALADTALLSPSGLSRAIERLEARGLVHRVPCTEDRRGSFAMLTDAGEALVRTAGETHATAIRSRFFDRLTAEERRLLAGIWERVLAGTRRPGACATAACAEQGATPMSEQAYSPAQMHAFNQRIVAEFRANGGQVGGMMAGVPLLLLTTVGARSGQQRIAPLTYGVDGDRLVVIAAKRGSPTNPDWYHNLVANPRVVVEVGRDAFPAQARVAAGAERQRLFAQMAERRRTSPNTNAASAARSR